MKYLDECGRWRTHENATAVSVKPGVCEITISELSPSWKAQAELLAASVLRVDGVETNRVIGARAEEGKVIATATARVTVPEAG